jgi:hypothetical protein
MPMPISSPSPVTRLGYHYYPDTFHYRVHDLDTWLPELSRLGASWITLLAPSERAIPEFFLNGLVSANIQPILHFQLPHHQLLPNESFRLLFGNYARWGVRYVALYDRPNVHANWDSSSWAQTDLVERFLDYYLPLASIAAQEGLTPIFPPLEPGGDYWDLAFLQTALQSIQRRGNDFLLEVLALGAYAWTGKHPVDWGAGGPERWPNVHPYRTSTESQDHLGFRIFDWYLAISQQELGKRLPIILLRAGSLPADHEKTEGALVYGIGHAQENLALASLLSGETDGTTGEQSMPPEVLACNFWLLAAHEQSVFAEQAWFQNGNKELPVVSAFRQWISTLRKDQNSSETTPSLDGLAEQESNNPAVESNEQSPVDVVFSGVDPKSVDNSIFPHEPLTEMGEIAEMDQKPGEVGQPDAGEISEEHPISHYVLLPLYSWGIANWDLALIQPILEDSHPTVGFSLAEARLAARVTVVGGEGAISPETLDMLRASGCRVERVLEDGTLVAT